MDDLANTSTEATLTDEVAKAVAITVATTAAMFVTIIAIDFASGLILKSKAKRAAKKNRSEEQD